MADGPLPQVGHVETVMDKSSDHKHAIRFESLVGDFAVQKLVLAQLGNPDRIKVRIEPAD